MAPSVVEKAPFVDFSFVDGLDGAACRSVLFAPADRPQNARGINAQDHADAMGLPR